TTRGGTATIVVELPALPLPSAQDDQRMDAIASAVAELERAGVPLDKQTILIASGLGRRPRQHEIAALVRPEFRRRFRGRVIVHDAESPELVPVGERDGVPLRAHPALVETDLVLVVAAAETVLDGGPGTLLRACGAEALRATSASSLLRARDADGWWLALELERVLGERVPVLGVSLVLDLPRIGGAVHGFPYDARSLEAIVDSPLRRPFGVLPRRARRALMMRVPRTIGTAAAFGGPASVAHAEALVRAIARRSARIERPLDAIVIGIPPPADVSSAVAVRRVGGVPARARPTRVGARRRLPRRDRRADARLRPGPRRARRARDGAGGCRRRGADRLPALAALLPDRRRDAVTAVV